jgi:hypothetical protein
MHASALARLGGASTLRHFLPARIRRHLHGARPFSGGSRRRSVGRKFGARPVVHGHVRPPSAAGFRLGERLLRGFVGSRLVLRDRRGGGVLSTGHPDVGDGNHTFRGRRGAGLRRNPALCRSPGDVLCSDRDRLHTVPRIVSDLCRVRPLQRHARREQRRLRWRRLPGESLSGSDIVSLWAEARRRSSARSRGGVHGPGVGRTGHGTGSRARMRDRQASATVYCSCRCANAAGSTNDGATYCPCPSGYSCTQVVPATQSGDPRAGAYCIKNGTVYAPNSACISLCNRTQNNCP